MTMDALARSRPSWPLAQEVLAPPRPETILDYIHAGGFLSYVLVMVSFVAVALIVRNLVLLRRRRLAPPAVLAGLEQALRRGDVAGALEICGSANHASFVARVMGSALLRCSRSPWGLLELRPALEEAGQREADRLHRVNDGVGIIAAVGPMLGLLGTVVGIIGAFATIGALEGAARSQQLAGWMAVALVCTAEGLIVAIPCTVAFSLFRRHIDHVVGEIADQIEHLTRALEQATAGPETGSGSRGGRPAGGRAAPTGGGGSPAAAGVRTGEGAVSASRGAPAA